MRATDGVAVFDHVADTYDRVAFPFFAVFGEALAEFAGDRTGRPRSRRRVRGRRGARARVPCRRDGRDRASAAMAVLAREAAPAAEVVEGHAAALRFAYASFDVALSSFVVFFMRDPLAALRERRALAPGDGLAMATWGEPDPGWAFGSDLRREFVPEMDRGFVSELGAGLPLTDRFNGPSKVEEELRGDGFEAERVQPFAIDFVFEDEHVGLELATRQPRLSRGSAGART